MSNRFLDRFDDAHYDSPSPSELDQRYDMECDWADFKNQQDKEDAAMYQAEQIEKHNKEVYEALEMITRLARFKLEHTKGDDKTDELLLTGTLPALVKALEL